MPRAPWQAFSSRVKFMAAALIVIMTIGWIAWFWPFDDLLDRSGTPLGADFSMFYAAGRVARFHPAETLYSQAAHQRELRSVFGELDPSFCLPYRYPPLVATLMSGLSRLPYPAAYAWFFVTSAALWGLTIRKLLRDSLPDKPAIRNTMALALAGWPVTLETLLGGQASMFTAGVAGAILLSLRRKQTVSTGVILALALLKPNVLALFALGLTIRFPRILLGFVPAAGTLIVLSGWATGLESLEQYFNLLVNLSSGPWDVDTPFWKVHSLSGWLELLFGHYARIVAILLGGSLSVAIGMAWRRHQHETSFAGWAAALLVVNALFNPYTPIYDLVLLGPAVILATASAMQTGRFVTRPTFAYCLVGLLFFGPHLSQAFATGTGLQIFPLGLLSLAAFYFLPRSSSAIRTAEACAGRESYAMAAHS